MVRTWRSQIADEVRACSMMKPKPFPERCDWHKPDDLSFLASHDDADRRADLGQHQYQCSVCFRWHWWHQKGRKPQGVKQVWRRDDEK